MLNRMFLHLQGVAKGLEVFGPNGDRRADAHRLATACEDGLTLTKRILDSIPTFAPSQPKKPKKRPRPRPPAVRKATTPTRASEVPVWLD